MPKAGLRLRRVSASYCNILRPLSGARTWRAADDSIKAYAPCHPFASRFEHSFMAIFSPLPTFCRLVVHLIAVACLCPVSDLVAGTPQPITLDLPIIDQPFNTVDGYTVPSMRQSLRLTQDVSQYAHKAIGDFFQRDSGKRFGFTLGFDALSMWLPFGSGWLHEEWHRAVMSNQHIDSYDEIYRFHLFDETISVSKVRDADLVRLKAEHPADLIRLHAAGIEAQYEMNLEIEKDIFFNGRPYLTDGIHWLNYANAISYLYVCATNESNRLTQSILDDEDTDISKRDFTGLDCNAWVYDLFRPTEPYSARGTHPSGVGINRYITYADLTDTEKDFLKRQFSYSFLNLLNPMLYRFDSFISTEPFTRRSVRWNVGVRHHLTSFGYSIDFNVFAQGASQKALFIWHNYFNQHHYFPGAAVSVFDYPVQIMHHNLLFTPSISIWLQPEGQAFATSRSRLGGFISGKLTVPWTQTSKAYVELEAKSAGWVAGNVYLDNNVSTRIGMIWSLR